MGTYTDCMSMNSTAKHSSSFLGKVWFFYKNARSMVPSLIAGLRNTSLPIAHPCTGHSHHDPGPVTQSGLCFFLKLSQMPSALTGTVRVRTQRGGDDVPSTRGLHSILVITRAQQLKEPHCPLLLLVL